jgi:6-phosphogluconate dehydrogenase
MDVHSAIVFSFRASFYNYHTFPGFDRRLYRLCHPCQPFTNQSDTGVTDYNYFTYCLLEAEMKIGLIGLGKMGANMAQRLILGGHQVVGFARNPATVAEVGQFGVIGAHSLEELVNKLPSPKIIWVMVPSGSVTEEVIQSAAALLSKGDILIDGGNSNYKDSVRRSTSLAEQGLRFMDVGTSGGVWGLTEGYSKIPPPDI